MDRDERVPQSTKVRAEPSPHADHFARAVIGAAIEVHRVLGPGMLERTYELALAHELTLRRIPFARQRPIDVEYKGERVGSYVLDLVVADTVIVELKSTSEVTNAHVAQALAYLTITKLDLALVLNFGEATLRSGIRRVIRAGLHTER